MRQRGTGSTVTEMFLRELERNGAAAALSPSNCCSTTPVGLDSSVAAGYTYSPPSPLLPNVPHDQVVYIDASPQGPYGIILASAHFPSILPDRSIPSDTSTEIRGGVL